MTEPVKTRRSTRRQMQAAQTRRDILDAAQALFERDGYAASSVDAIAQHANVARATVFATVGTKADILKALRDRALAGDDDPVPVTARPWFRDVVDAPDAWQAIRLHARNIRDMCERAARLEAVLAAAAAADPQLRGLHADSQRQRGAGARTVAEILGRKGPLRSGLDLDGAADLLFALASPELYLLLVATRNWTPSRYQHWLADTLAQQLLAHRRAED
jgi:AcrR family transcriptional regulator